MLNYDFYKEILCNKIPTNKEVDYENVGSIHNDNKYYVLEDLVETLKLCKKPNNDIIPLLELLYSS